MSFVPLLGLDGGLRAFGAPLVLWVSLLTGACAPAVGPYDEGADAARDVAAALAEAQLTGKRVLLNFGANWCPDCRAFAAALGDPALAGVLQDRFVAVKIDVGNWDKHPDVVAEWGNPIAEGIPAVVVATAEGEVLFASRRGQISTARNMGRSEFVAFFERLAALAPAGL